MGCFSAILCEDSPDVRESKTVLDSGFHDMDRFRIPTDWIRNRFQWDLDSGFQSLVGFWIPTALYSGFQGPGFRIN